MAYSVMERGFQGPDPRFLNPRGINNTTFGTSDSFNEQEVRRQVAKLLVFGFNGKTVNSHARQLIASGAGGVILFGRNVEDPFQLAELCAALKREAGSRPLITMIDQEGGLVQRVGPPFTAIPSAQMVGATADPKAAGAIGSVLGKELRTIHIDMNLAPVLDVDTTPSNPVLQGRSFGSCPETVAEMGYHFIRALQNEGVAACACAKHFPGLGRTHVDSHEAVPHLSQNWDDLNRTDMLPFGRAVEADAAAIMVGHVLVPPLAADNEEGLQLASLSFDVVHHLRDELLFDGVILSDSLEMGAVMKLYPVEEAAVMAVMAGIDMLVVSHDRRLQVRVIASLVEAVKVGQLPYERVEEAERRIDNFVNLYCMEALNPSSHFENEYQAHRMNLIGCREHQNIVASVMHDVAMARLGNRNATT